MAEASRLNEAEWWKVVVSGMIAKIALKLPSDATRNLRDLKRMR